MQKKSPSEDILIEKLCNYFNLSIKELLAIEPYWETLPTEDEKVDWTIVTNKKLLEDRQFLINVMKDNDINNETLAIGNIMDAISAAIDNNETNFIIANKHGGITISQANYLQRLYIYGDGDYYE